MREVPWNGDGDFTWERFDERYTADLANDLGNLANRSLSMIGQYRDATVPQGESTALDTRALAALERYQSAMDQFLLHQGLAAAMELAGQANVYIEESAPWKLAKDASRHAELDAVLASLARCLARLSILLSPFMPTKSAELWAALGRDGVVPSLTSYEAIDLSGETVAREAVLFPKVEA